MKKTRRSVIMKAAAILLAGTMVSSPMSGLIAFAEEEESGYATVTNTLEVDPVYVGETITIEEEPVVEFEGTVTDDNPVYEYTYTAENSGSYYFGIEDVKENCSVSFAIYDSLENKICNSANDVVNLEEAETYTLRISQRSGNTPFTLQIKSQKPTMDISDATLINDQIMFGGQYEGQKNNYIYTAKTSGTYCFTLNNIPTNVTFDFSMGNQYKPNVCSDTLGKGGYVTAELEEGESYDIQISYVWYNHGIGSYTLQIQEAKETVDVTGITEIYDSLEFDGQDNYYIFTAPVSGEYNIGIDITFERYEYYIYDDEGNNVGRDNWAINQSEIKASLDENKLYTIRMVQASGFGDYTIKISYPSTAQEYLEDFAKGNTGTVSSTSSDESETEGTSDDTASADSSQTDILQQQINELQSELEDMQEENDRLKEILEENEIVYD